MNVELLVDAAEFWERLRIDLAGATDNAYVQTFSFEGDRVGTSLGRALERCPARDKRLLVDSYTRLYHNDRLVPGPAWLDRTFRREVLLTRRWVQRLRAGGTGVRFGNPLWPGMTRILRRNHKKLALVDDRVVYLGGINFSDHNFDWHDMMFRVEDPALGRLLAADFRASWAGTPRSMDVTVGTLRILSLNGWGNAHRLEPVVSLIQGATRSVDVVSAYLSHPFTRHLADARRRGVRVRVLTPARNNKSNLARHVIHQGHRRGLEVFKYAGGMSHMKAMLVDDTTLVAGSSNFDSMSYHILEELVFITRDPRFVEPFRTRVWDVDLAAARRV
ncbi:MAG TPA: phosphatidylserine/phosphatidylglycerophosphate/cardiolipin synthase family protein, partial [Longimicrobiales bacterium]|nr:phosphatidylserine/phosphatidylglycerophosphate/cardiolipin synthase family protein [Longimicrobiales bacterium]